MRPVILIVLTIASFCIDANCQPPSDTALINSIRKTIKSQYTSWVVFANGTFLVITADSATPKLKGKATKILKQLRDIEGQVIRENTLVIDKSNAEGWIVNSNTAGLYTYVSTRDCKLAGKYYPTNIDIAAIAGQKRQKDIANPKIIFVSL